jgi:hypothetical protein
VSESDCVQMMMMMMMMMMMGESENREEKGKYIRTFHYEMCRLRWKASDESRTEEEK